MTGRKMGDDDSDNGMHAIDADAMMAVKPR